MFSISWTPPVKGKEIIIVISPLNALMQDEICKLDHLGALILDGTQKSNELGMFLATN